MLDASVEQCEIGHLDKRRLINQAHQEVGRIVSLREGLLNFSTLRREGLIDISDECEALHSSKSEEI